MRHTVTRLSRSITLVAGVAAVGLVSAGCTADGPPADPASPVAGEGVPFGATIAEYQAAFEGVDPITLRFQTPDGQGYVSNLPLEHYGEALEEWSGGKISIEWGFSNSFVPAATEWNIGLGDGRIDIGLFLPYYNPDLFPQLTNLSALSFLEGAAPSSTLVSSGWLTEAAQLPQYVEEAAQSGVKVLGLAPSVSLGGIFCSEQRTSLADFEGVAASASGLRGEQLRSLGISPQSIAFTELYEALERGIVQCGTTTTTAIDSAGLTPLVPHAIFDPVASVVGFPNFIAISDEAYNSLPLVAQQLVHDLLRIYYLEEPGDQGERISGWLEESIAAGGGIMPFAEDARTVLLETNQRILEQLAAEGLDTDEALAIFEKWRDRVNEELYPDLTEDLEAFLTDYGYRTLDVQPLVDAIWEETLLPLRPGS